MSTDEFHRAIARAALPEDATEEDVLLYMALIHLHGLRLKQGVSFDDVAQGERERAVTLAALTQRHAASVVASLWPIQDSKGQYEYWYSRYNRLTPYEVVSDVPSGKMARLQAFREALLGHPQIDAVDEE